MVNPVQDSAFQVAKEGTPKPRPMIRGFPPDVPIRVINAEKHIAGRLASYVAKRLLMGEYIVIVNAEKAVITGDPHRIVRWYMKKIVEWCTHYNPEKAGPKIPRRPDRILKRIVRGMLPRKTWRGRMAFRRLKVFIGVPEELKHLPFEVIPDAMLRDETKPHITLEELSRLVGGWPPKYVRKKLTTRYVKLPITGSEGNPEG